MKSVLAAVLLAAGVLIWRFGFLTRDQAAWLESYLGYYWVLAALVAFFWAAWNEGRCAVIDLRGLIRRHAAGLALVIAGAAYLHLHEPHCLKVLYDEPSHIAGSLMMHTERMAVMPGRAHLVHGHLQCFDLFPSFRLYLFQVLLSLVHDVSGFRASNVFLLNGALSIAFLGLMYWIGVRMHSRRAGVLAVLLFAGLPLLAQVATSGSYDLLNLVLLAALFLSARHYSRSVGTCGLDLMVSTGVLLALCRYESIVYLVVPIVIVLEKWKRERTIALTPFAVLSPVLILPNLVANKIMVSTDAYLLGQLRDKLKVDFFNIDYIGDHLREAVFYLFQFDNTGTNSVLFSVLGALGLVAVAVALVGRWTLKWRLPNANDALVVVFLGVTIGLFLMTLANFWGSPTAIEATRFTLPLHFAGALAALWALHDLLGARAIPRWFLLLLAAFVGLFTTSANNKHVSTNMMLASNSYRWFVNYAKEHDRGRTLYASSSQIPLLIEGFPVVQIEHLNRDPNRVLQVMQARIYDEVLVHELIPIGYSAEFAPPPNQIYLGRGFAAEVVATNKFSTDSYSRILRIRACKNADGKYVTPEEAPPLKDRFESLIEFERYYRSLLP